MPVLSTMLWVCAPAPLVPVFGGSTEWVWDMEWVCEAPAVVDVCDGGSIECECAGTSVMLRVP